MPKILRIICSLLIGTTLHSNSLLSQNPVNAAEQQDSTDQAMKTKDMLGCLWRSGTLAGMGSPGAIESADIPSAFGALASFGARCFRSFGRHRLLPHSVDHLEPARDLRQRGSQS